MKLSQFGLASWWYLYLAVWLPLSGTVTLWMCRRSELLRRKCAPLWAATGVLLVAVLTLAVSRARAGG